jgi:hypothetical protein
MKKILVGIFLFFLTIFFVFKISAQETGEKLKSEPISFSIEAIYKPCEDETDPNCVDYPVNTDHPDPLNEDHEFGLYADGLPANTDIYIVGCITTEVGAHCTSGDQNIDNLLNSYPGDQMVADPNYQFKALKNPVKTDSNGVLENIIVRSFTASATTHSFLAYYISTPTGSTGEKNNLSIVPTTNALQQGTIDFNIATPSPKPRNKKPVREINNDPRGRFFDIKSLEPIPEGEVTLLNNLKKTFIYSNLVNPQKVKINGEFNFWVPNGVYYLSLTQLPTGYSWPTKIENVNPNYLKAYYCDSDVKNDKKQTVPLYLDQYSINEYNKLVHCDVPLDPGNNSPHQSSVTGMEFSVSKENQGQSTYFLGKVTHPLTIVSLKAETTNALIASTTADKLGYWKIDLANSNYPLKNRNLPDRLIVTYKKVDLTGTNTNIPEVKGNIYEPLLNYVEGYAYDETGKVLANAKVGYRQQGTEKIVYVTTADSNGFFKIPTRYLPSFSYELVFTPAGKNNPIILSTSQFVSKNADYLKKKDLNLLTKRNQEILGNKLLKNAPDFLKPTTTNLNNLTTEKSKEENQRQNLIIGIIFLILIIFISIIALVVLYKKNKKPPLTESY